jgi:hypothetical protein
LNKLHACWAGTYATLPALLPSLNLKFSLNDPGEASLPPGSWGLLSASYQLFMLYHNGLIYWLLGTPPEEGGACQ